MQQFILLESKFRKYSKQKEIPIFFLCNFVQFLNQISLSKYDFLFDEGP